MIFCDKAIFSGSSKHVVSIAVNDSNGESDAFVDGFLLLGLAAPGGDTVSDCIAPITVGRLLTSIFCAGDTGFFSAFDLAFSLSLGLGASKPLL